MRAYKFDAAILIFRQMVYNFKTALKQLLNWNTVEVHMRSDEHHRKCLYYKVLAHLVQHSLCYTYSNIDSMIVKISFGNVVHCWLEQTFSITQMVSKCLSLKILQKSYSKFFPALWKIILRVYHINKM